MKSSRLIALASTAICGFALTNRAQATLLFEDGFNYPAGALNASAVNPFTGNAWSSGSSRITVASGNLTYSGLQDLGGNEVQNVWTGAGSVINTFANTTSGQIYYSFLLNITAAPSADQFLTALNPGTSTPNGSSDAINLYVNTSDQLRLRTAGKSETTDTLTTLSLNTTYLVVLEYDFDGTVANMWIDPTIGGSQPTADVSIAASGTVTAIANVGFKAQSATSGSFLIDNVFIGTTWADVTPSAVPEPTSLALAGLGLIGVIAKLRRR